MQRLTPAVLTSLCLTSVTLAHPGHGYDAQDTRANLLHFLAEHWLPAAVIAGALLLVSLGLLQLRRRLARRAAAG